MTSQKVEFPGADNVLLSGILETPDTDVRAWAVFAHCFTCSKKSLASSRIAGGLANRGIGVLRFDFTGLGESDGDFSDTGFSSNVSDLRAAIAWMGANDHPIDLLIGHSLGGAASVVAASEESGVRAVVTLGAPSDAGHVIAQFDRHIPEIEARGEAEVNLAGRPFTLKKSFLDDVRGAKVIDAVKSLNRPLLVMHAPTDQIVGIDNATDLFVHARHPKSFVSLDDADHLLTRPEDAEFVADVISGWSRRYLISRSKKSSVPMEQSHSVIVQETGQFSRFQNSVLIDGRAYLADEPIEVGGSNTGPDPYDWVTAGLGACTSMTLRMYADRKGWPLQRVTVRLSHAKQHNKDCVDCGPKDRIDVFTRDIEIAGDLSTEQRSRLLEIADRCPVHRTLEASSVVQTRDATISA